MFFAEVNIIYIVDLKIFSFYIFRTVKLPAVQKAVVGMSKRDVALVAEVLQGMAIDLVAVHINLLKRLMLRMNHCLQIL